MAFFFSEDLESLLKDKWLLWDTCALIRTTDCDADKLFRQLAKLWVENVTIKPVLLELGATNDQKLALKRADYADRHISVVLKTNIDGPRDSTTVVQEALPKSSQPGAVDLMLASTLVQYGGGKKMLLVTENIKDFPEPLFTKEGFMMVSNETKSFGLTLLTIDSSKLPKT